MDNINFLPLCIDHPNQICDLFSTNTESSLVLHCTNCKTRGNDVDYPFIKIEDVINCSKNQILDNWPPLGDTFKNLIQILKAEISSALNSIDGVETYFQNLEEEMIQELRKKKKEIFASFSSSSLLIETYTKIAKIDNLKQIFMKANDSHFINNSLKKEIEIHLSQSEQSIKKMQAVIEAHKKNSINEQKLNTWKEKLIESIHSFSNWQIASSQMKNIKMLKSPYSQDSTGLEIIQRDSQDILHKQVISFININGFYQYAHIEPSLQNHLKYKINLEIKSYAQENTQRIGLVADLNELWRGDQSILQFVNRGSQQNCKRVLKGEDIWDRIYYNKKNLEGEHTRKVELRVCVKDRIFQAFDYPNYENGISFNASFLSMNLKYYLALFSCSGKDTIILEDFCIVDSF